MKLVQSIESKFAHVYNLYSGENRMKLTENLLKITDVHQLVEQLSNILQKAIVLENKNFELITYSSPDEASFDPVQQKTILAKRCPLFIIERLKKEGIIDQLKESSHPIRIRPIKDINFYQRVAISLTYFGEVYGYLWINEKKELLKEEEFSIITNVAPHMAKILYDEAYIGEQNPQQVIWKLLNGEYVSEVEVSRAAKLASFQIPEHFNVMIGSIKDPTYLPILDKLKEVFIEERVAYYLGKGTEIVGIVGGSNNNRSDEKSLKIIEKIHQKLTDEERRTFIIGIGNVYHKYKQLRKSYLEALEVIETKFFLNVGKQTKFTINQLGVLRYIKLMYQKNVSEQYRNRTITILMKKDAENNSELLKTLWYFLKNDRKVGKTAEQLFIHPNTLNYRLKQIYELTKINLSDIHERTELYLHLLILNYVKDYEEFYKKFIY